MAERSPETGLVRLDDEGAGEGEEATRVGELDSAKVQEMLRQADVREATAVPPLQAAPRPLPASGVVARGARASAPAQAPPLPVARQGERPTFRPKHDPDARTVELGGELVASVLRGEIKDPGPSNAGRADSSVLRAASPSQSDASPFAGASEPPPRASMASLPPAPVSASTPTSPAGLGPSLAIGVGVFVAITVPALWYLFVK